MTIIDFCQRNRIVPFDLIKVLKICQILDTNGLPFYAYRDVLDGTGWFHVTTESTGPRIEITEKGIFSLDGFVAEKIEFGMIKKYKPRKLK